MAEGDKHTVLARSPLRHWGLERGEKGEVTIGDGSPGTVTQADFDGRLEIGHAAIIAADASDDGAPAAKKAAAKKATTKPAAAGDEPPAP